VPYTSSQNGTVERSIQTSEGNVRAMLKGANQGVAFWDEAVMAQAHIRNRTSIEPELNGSPTTPLEHWIGQKPSVDHIRVWGPRCFCYVNPKSLPDRKDSLMDRARLGMLVGYANTDKQYRI